MPVFGAGTSNSQFEFLSGDSISFLPTGCNVYQSPLKDTVPSLVSTPCALLVIPRPLSSVLWVKVGTSRNVYPLLALKTISVSKILSIRISWILTNRIMMSCSMRHCFVNAIPDHRNMLLRRFVSDSYDYPWWKNMFENRDTSKPFFLFNVTMQNHGGYAMSLHTNFAQEVM